MWWARSLEICRTLRQIGTCGIDLRAGSRSVGWRMWRAASVVHPCLHSFTAVFRPFSAMAGAIGDRRRLETVPGMMIRYSTVRQVMPSPGIYGTSLAAGAGQPLCCLDAPGRPDFRLDCMEGRTGCVSRAHARNPLFPDRAAIAAVIPCRHNPFLRRGSLHPTSVFLRQRRFCHRGREHSNGEWLHRRDIANLAPGGVWA